MPCSLKQIHLKERRELKQESIRFIDMFAGIGGFREGLQLAGGFACVGFCECDKYALRSYRALFDCEEEWYSQDARTIDPAELPEFVLLCGGFPCQAFSIAGSRKGFGDSRGTLFFELARLAEARKPRYLLFENVPGLLNHDGGRTFAAILDALGDWGIMWNGRCLTARISASPNPAAVCTLSDILMSDVEEKYFLSPQQMKRLLPASTTGREEAGSTTPAE